MHVEQLGEIIPPPIHNTVGVRNQVAFLSLNYITSRLVPLLKVIDAPIQVPNVSDERLFENKCFPACVDDAESYFCRVYSD